MNDAGGSGEWRPRWPNGASSIFQGKGGRRCLLPLLEKIMKEGKPLLVIAGEVKGEALSFLVVNHVQGRMRAAAVKAPGFGDRRTAMLGDIAALTGGTVITQDAAAQLENAGLEHLGRARRAVVTKDETILVDGAGDRETVHHRIGQIREQIENSDSDHDREKLQERLAKLDCGVAVIKVGAATEAELMKRKYLVAQAVRTAKAAVEEGTVPGGGVALLDAGDIALGKWVVLKGDEQAGAMAVGRALSVPLEQIAANVGLEGNRVCAEVRSLPAGHGLNATTREYVDLRAAGIIEPVRVPRSALQKAARAVSIILITGVAELPGRPQGEGLAGGWRGWGDGRLIPPPARSHTTAEQHRRRLGRHASRAVVQRGAGRQYRPVRGGTGAVVWAGIVNSPVVDRDTPACGQLIFPVAVSG
ncbi:Heat shock protein 60 family chaperone GroEL [Streptomyces sp. 769]|nr:Heat shock protein 60 family chaperone GroEL [Streptomyces sp. 769]